MEGEEECEREEILMQPILENIEVAEEITEKYCPQYEGPGQVCLCMHASTHTHTHTHTHIDYIIRKLYEVLVLG